MGTLDNVDFTDHDHSRWHASEVSDIYDARIRRELGRKLKWNPIREEFAGDDEANKRRSRPRRKGYELPEIA
jgi:hypothetical protein